jgi:molybdopterin-containing oxidoreductase family iron-sulfur binding subunit
MPKEISRRTFIKASGVTVAAVAVSSGVGLSPPALAAEQGTVQYGMVFDMKKCIRCGACTIACIAENHLPPGVVYDPVLEREIGQYPNVRKENTPLICNHCQKPPCVRVCPVNATWRRPEDGIVVIDYDKCIGCRYCLTACPYQMRYFDFGEYYNLEPRTDWYDGAPSPEYNQRRVRSGTHQSPIGNARKCTFCLHRVKKGLKPACVEACLGRARYFGNLADPNDELWELISRNGHMRLKEEHGTEPSVYYLL